MEIFARNKLSQLLKDAEREIFFGIFNSMPELLEVLEGDRQVLFDLKNRIMNILQPNPRPNLEPGPRQGPFQTTSRAQTTNHMQEVVNVEDNESTEASNLEQKATQQLKNLITNYVQNNFKNVNETDRLLMKKININVNLKENKAKISSQDKMNFDAIEKICSEKSVNLLKQISDSEATVQYLCMTRNILDAFLQKNLSIGDEYCFPREENRKLGTGISTAEKIPTLEEMNVIIKKAEEHAKQCAVELGILCHDIETVIVSITGDGNCLFSHQNKHQQLRNDAVKYIDQNWNEFDSFVFVPGHILKNEYCRKMSQIGEYGTYLECVVVVVVVAVVVAVVVVVVKRIPKGARQCIAEELSFLLNKCCSNNKLNDWIALFIFPYAVLKVPLKPKSVENLTSAVKFNVRDWSQNKLLPLKSLINKYSNTKQAYKRKSKMEKTFGDSNFLAKKVEIRISEGDIKGAIRLSCSENTIAAKNEETLLNLQEKLPCPQFNQKEFPSVPKDSIFVGNV
ncbi:unnamed protein product [Ceutorhynchus assimilis]|uniref:Uncharacterized protein n=1 Tax=Ceutorhynchus assimilis TaxID=467358 RepID=A0A9N9Q8K5_9CUCU|nr:unnamed protein product [Ceutorhynchus assimilis]